MIQVVARYSPRNFGEILADEIAIGRRDAFELAVDFATAPPFADDVLKFVARGLTNLHSCAVVSEDFELFDIVVGLARHDRMHAARIVADHAAEGAMVMRGWVGSECRVMFFGGVAKTIEDNYGLDSRDAADGINLKDFCHGLGEIDNDRNVAALACQGRAAAAA